MHAFCSEFVDLALSNSNYFLKKNTFNKEWVKQVIWGTNLLIDKSWLRFSINLLNGLGLHNGIY